MKIEEIINKIVWYVPFRKKRDLLRNELNQLIKLDFGDQGIG